MKRSEMIELAAKLFEKNTLTQQYSSCSYESVAEEFLNIFEELGMACPHHPTEGYNYEELNPTGTTTYGRKYIRKWELE